MRKINKVAAALAVVALMTLTWVNASANMAASCTKGTTKICFKITTAGGTTYNCNDTTGNVKDCQ